MAQPPSPSNTKSNLKTNRQKDPSESSEIVARLFSWLDARELFLVRMTSVNPKRYPNVFAINSFLNSLGNGWLYLIVGLLLVGLKGFQAWRVILAASVSIGFLHLFYPRIKSHLARARPCDFDPTLSSSVKCLDDYSCPSGHIMTAVAAAIPIGLAYPVTLLAICFVLFLVAWSRLALAHHYPTDLLIGGIIGAMTSFPISTLLLRL